MVFKEFWFSDQSISTLKEKTSCNEEYEGALHSLPPAPFALLSFLALPVIPELRLTDLGLVDVAGFKLLK